MTFEDTLLELNKNAGAEYKEGYETVFLDKELLIGDFEARSKEEAVCAARAGYAENIIYYDGDKTIYKEGPFLNELANFVAVEGKLSPALVKEKKYYTVYALCSAYVDVNALVFRGILFRQC